MPQVSTIWKHHRPTPTSGVARRRAKHQVLQGSSKETLLFPVPSRQWEGKKGIQPSLQLRHWLLVHSTYYQECVIACLTAAWEAVTQLVKLLSSLHLQLNILLLHYITLYFTTITSEWQSAPERVYFFFNLTFPNPSYVLAHDKLTTCTLA